MLLGQEPVDPKNPTGPQRVLYDLKECPKSYITNESRDHIKFYLEYMTMEKPLLVEGGLLDQPALEVDILRIIKEEVSKVEASFMNEKRKEYELKAKQQAMKQNRSSSRGSRR